MTTTLNWNKLLWRPTIAKKRDKKAGKSNGKASAGSQAKIRDYDAHVLVCCGGDCKKKGSKKTRKALKSGLREAGINRDVRIDSVDCLGLCKHGPNVVVYPAGTWYLGLDESSSPEVVQQHLKGGEPVERLAAEFRPRQKTSRAG